jgi:hypothetical protein
VSGAILSIESLKSKASPSFFYTLNGLKLSRKGPIPNDLDQKTQEQAKPASFRRHCQDSGSGPLSDPTLS